MKHAPYIEYFCFLSRGSGSLTKNELADQFFTKKKDSANINTLN